MMMKEDMKQKREKKRREEKRERERERDGITNKTQELQERYKKPSKIF